VPLKFRWSPSGRAKQQLDEAAGWQRLVAITAGTPAAAHVAGATQVAAPGFDANHANYARWREAHRKQTLRARIERQRAAQAALHGPPVIGAVLPCQVDPALVVRPTIQIALLTQATHDVSGTRLGQATGRSVAQLLTHLRQTLTALEDELNVRARHHEAQDLTHNGAPPVRLFVASEWYFRPAGRTYSTAEHGAVIAGLEGLSAEFPDWLLCPGTIYWSPDPPANPILRVFNQAPVLHAGSVILTRTKHNEHDIPVQTQGLETWGMNNPGALPGAITPASVAPAIFNHAALEWCLDICRDHAVGEGACGYAAAAPANPGPNVYIVTANTTPLEDHFNLARNNGVLVHCDGGNGAYAVYTVNRVVAFNAPALNGALLAYQPLFAAQRAPLLAFADAQIHVHQTRQDPAYVTFMARFTPMMAPASVDPLRAALLLAHGLAGAPHTHNGDTRDAYCIEQVLLAPHVVGGVATTPAEALAMAAYFPHLRAQGVAQHVMAPLIAPGNATFVAKAAVILQAGAVNKVAVAALGHQPHASASLFPLIDT
jgi:hypothetical protein